MSAATNVFDIEGGDFFCGAGGGSTAFIAARDELDLSYDLLAINHDQTSIATHSANHKQVRHLCENLEALYPPVVVPKRHLHFALFAPECTNHSRAKGGKPKNDQSRSTAWTVIRWAEEIEIENILVENVPEFVDWGPLYPKGHPKEDKPIPSKKGQFFKEWFRLLRSRGYTIEWRILNAAYYGDATSRKRFFLQAKKRGKITWPEATHESTAENLAGRPKFRGAKEIINWELEGTSIYGRKKDLAPNTMRRIYAGLEKFSGLSFVLGQQSGSAPRSTDDPLPTISTAGAISLIQPYVQPYLVVLRNNCDALPIDGPLPTICAEGGHICLAEPFILPQFSSQDAREIDRPLGTLTTQSRGVGVVSPFIVPVTHSQAKPKGHDVEMPLPTITTAKGGEFALVRPFLTKYHGPQTGRNERVQALEDPLATIDTSNRFALVDPVIIPVTHSGGEKRCHSIEDPLPTITGANRGELAIADAYLISYKGNDNASSIESPLPSPTCKGRFAVCEPVVLPPEGIYRGNAPRSIDDPLATITQRGGGQLAQFLVSYYGNGDAFSVDDPLGTVTTKPRFALVDPSVTNVQTFDKGDIIGLLDIKLRMLQPEELSRAMGFPEDYHFEGNKEQRVKQIGNAIAHNVCKALCTEILKPYAEKKRKTGKKSSKGSK